MRVAVQASATIDNDDIERTAAGVVFLWAAHRGAATGSGG